MKENNNSEFAIIERYFQGSSARSDVLLGIGDDAALLTPPPGQSLVVTVDLLAAGVHFLADADPRGIGHKSLAVNLSDLAAMGAEPAWGTLAIALPGVEPDWLAAFCEGFFSLAEQYNLQLVGGDTTRGPLTISVQVHGFVPADQALRRDGARPGDRIMITGIPGEAALALAGLQGRAELPGAHRDTLLARLERPSPRIVQGLDLRGLATSAIDISDGLVQDLGHILRRSQVGARLLLERLPRSVALQGVEPGLALDCQLGGGDDYELLFTVAPPRLAELRRRAAAWDCELTEIGEIKTGGDLRLIRADGSVYTPTTGGFDHFAGIQSHD